MSEDHNKDIWYLSNQNAVRQAVFEAEQTGDKEKDVSKSSVEIVSIDNKDATLIRRTALFGAISSLIYACAPRIENIILGNITNLAYDKGKDAVNSREKISFDDGFIKYIDKFRGNLQFSEDNARRMIGLNLKKEELDTIKYMEWATSGGIFGERDVRSLEEMINRSADIRTKIILCNLLGTDKVRKGLSTDAFALINSINYNEIKDVRTLSRLSELAFNFAYTSVAKNSALSPLSWGFEYPFSVSHQIGLPELGIKSTFDHTLKKYAFNFSMPKPEKITEYEREFGVSGFYNMFWTLLYEIATKSRDNVRLAQEIADELRKILISFIKINDKYKRTVWNSLFIVALQAHRSNIFETRDKFIKTMTGIDGKIYSHSYFDQRLNNKDVISYCAAIFILTNPKMCKTIGLTEMPSVEKVELLGRELVASELRSSADLFEKIRGKDIQKDRACNNNFFWGGGLSILIEDQCIIRNGLINFNNKH